MQSPAPDPSASVKRFLTHEARDTLETMLHASEALVAGSQVSTATQVTARRMLAAERHMDSTAALLQQLERTVGELDADVTWMVESITKLEDVADTLLSVQISTLYDTMRKA